jgi:hypothetical protein
MLVISAYIPSGKTSRVHLHSGVNLRILGDQRGIRGLAINKPDEALHPKSLLRVAAVYEELCLRFTRQHVVQLENFSFLFDPTVILHMLRHPSVSGKIFCSEVVLVDSGLHKHLPHASDHGGRTSTVINRPIQCGKVP